MVSLKNRPILGGTTVLVVEGGRESSLRLIGIAFIIQIQGCTQPKILSQH